MEWFLTTAYGHRKIGGGHAVQILMIEKGWHDSTAATHDNGLDAAVNPTWSMVNGIWLVCKASIQDGLQLYLWCVFLRLDWSWFGGVHWCPWSLLVGRMAIWHDTRSQDAGVRSQDITAHFDSNPPWVSPAWNMPDGMALLCASPWFLIGILLLT